MPIHATASRFTFRTALATGALAGLVGLAGCTVTQPAPSVVVVTPPAATVPAGDSCNANPAAAYAIGKVSTAQLEQESGRLAGASLVRSLFKGQPVTMEYLAGRLNLIMDAQRVVEQVTCG